MTKNIYVDQVQILTSVSELLGGVCITTKKMNKLLSACANFAKEINEILSEEDVFYKNGDNVSIKEWISSDDVGESSKFMSFIVFEDELKGTAFFNERMVKEKPYPHDPSDFGRCVRMLEATGYSLDLNLKIKIAYSSKYWDKVMENWDDWVKLYKQGDGEKLYKEMQKAYNSIN